jgi:hypothetical protein
MARRNPFPPPPPTITVDDLPTPLKTELKTVQPYLKLLRADARPPRPRDGKVIFVLLDQQTQEKFYLALDKKPPLNDDDEGNILRQQNLALLARIQALEKQVAALTP